jgi:periplasmic divalent cation tolerance protein
MVKSEYCILFSAVDSKEKGEEIAEQAVNRRLAAGVNLIPGLSIYRWKGDIKRADEHIMLFYTRTALSEALATLIKELHPYEVAPASSIEIINGLEGFLEWIGSNTASNVEDY